MGASGPNPLGTVGTADQSQPNRAPAQGESHTLLENSTALERSYPKWKLSVTHYKDPHHCQGT